MFVALLFVSFSCLCNNILHLNSFVPSVLDKSNMSAYLRKGLIWEPQIGIEDDCLLGYCAV
jgi:hypothetical protein